MSRKLLRDDQWERIKDLVPGKTMLAQRLPGILPPMTEAEVTGVKN